MVRFGETAVGLEIVEVLPAGASTMDQANVSDWPSTSREADPHYTACLIRAPAGCRGGGIFLAPGQDSGRKPFSMAHELGHFHIPSHARTGANGTG